MATSEPSRSIGADNVPLLGAPLRKSRPEISRSNSTSTHQRLTNQRAEEVVSRRWSVSAAANQRWSRLHKALASTIVGRLNATLFMSTRRLFKEAQCPAADAVWKSMYFFPTLNVRHEMIIVSSIWAPTHSCSYMIANDYNSCDDKNRILTQNMVHIFYCKRIFAVFLTRCLRESYRSRSNVTPRTGFYI